MTNAKKYKIRVYVSMDAPVCPISGTQQDTTTLTRRYPTKLGAELVFTKSLKTSKILNKGRVQGHVKT